MKPWESPEQGSDRITLTSLILLTAAGWEFNLRENRRTEQKQGGQLGTIAVLNGRESVVGFREHSPDQWLEVNLGMK